MRLSKIIVSGLLALGMAVTFLAGSGNTMAQAAELKIGYVDLQQVISLSEGGKRAQADMQAKADDFKKQADERNEKLQALRDEYKKQAEMLSADTKQQKQDEISKLQVELDRFIKDSQDALAREEQRILAQILEVVGKLVVEYGQQQQFTVILEAGNILYGAEHIDITQEIVNLYNSKQQQ